MEEDVVALGMCGGEVEEGTVVVGAGPAEKEGPAADDGKHQTTLKKRPIARRTANLPIWKFGRKFAAKKEKNGKCEKGRCENSRIGKCESASC